MRIFYLLCILLLIFALCFYGHSHLEKPRLSVSMPEVKELKRILSEIPLWPNGGPKEGFQGQELGAQRDTERALPNHQVMTGKTEVSVIDNKPEKVGGPKTSVPVGPKAELAILKIKFEKLIRKADQVKEEFIR